MTSSTIGFAARAASSISRRVCDIFRNSRARRALFQCFQYGFWRIPVIEKHGRPTTIRQMVPTLFYAACVVLALAGWWAHEPLVALALPLTYVTALLIAAAAIVPRVGVRVAACLPVAIATMHAGYGWGLGYGMWARLFRAGAWDAEGKMAAISR